MRIPLENPEGGSFNGELEKRTKGGGSRNGLSLSVGARGTCRKGSFTGDPDEYVKERSGRSISLHEDPVGEPRGGLT